MMLNVHRALLSVAKLPAAETWVTSAPWMRSMVSRFIAGDTVDDALRVASELQGRRINAALDLLGENVSDALEADRATRAFIDLLAAASAACLTSPYISIKLTALGLDISEALATENLRRILEAARNTENAFVRVDMEASTYTEATLRIVKGVRSEFDNVGVVLQSYLYRTDADVEAMIAAKVPVRLVKGAYAEPATVAYPEKKDVDAAYRRQLAHLLESRLPTAVATHDGTMIRIAKRTMREKRLDNDAVEFQLLLGVRSDLRDDLAEEGYHVRAYIPFGSHWYPYFVRRLAERPANLMFILKNLRG